MLEDRIIPTLTGENARRFIKMAEEAEERARNRKMTGTSPEHEEMLAILKKSGMLSE